MTSGASCSFLLLLFSCSANNALNTWQRADMMHLLAKITLFWPPTMNFMSLCVWTWGVWKGVYLRWKIYLISRLLTSFLISNANVLMSPRIVSELVAAPDMFSTGARTTAKYTYREKRANCSSACGETGSIQYHHSKTVPRTLGNNDSSAVCALIINSN